MKLINEVGQGLKQDKAPKKGSNHWKPFIQIKLFNSILTSFVTHFSSKGFSDHEYVD